KHLRTHHNFLDVRTCLRCGICRTDVTKPAKQHQCLQAVDLYVPATHLQWRCDSCCISFPSDSSFRNHLAGHKKADLREAAPKLSLPPPSSRKHKRRRKDAAVPVDIGEPSIVSDPATVLARPVIQGDIVTCPDDSVGGPISHFLEQLDAFLADQVPTDAFNSFENLVDEIVQTAVSHLFPDGPPPSGSGSSPVKINMDDPATCQRLYTRNRRRAVREITGISGNRCKIPLDSLVQHFSNCWSAGDSDLSLFGPLSSEGRVPVLDTDFSPPEVWDILKKPENTAPGADRLTYFHLRTVDPGALVLTKLFNICVRFRRVPGLWKRSTTILIPKAGDPELISNWRPIALSCTAYKTFAKCLSKRLANFCERFDVLSPCQKGFMPFDGVIEHNFLLQTAIEKARASKRDICTAWLDVSNAFGTLPHCAIFNALRCNGVGESLVQRVEDIYTQSTTSILTEEGVSVPVPVSSGVAVLLTKSWHLLTISELQVKLNETQHLLGRLRLTLNPGKSYSFHLHGSTPVGVVGTEFFLGANRLCPLAEGEFHRFLGKPVGFNPVPDYSSLSDLADLGTKLVRAKLTPWQRIDTLKSFFFPCLQFPMRTGQFPKEDWGKIDRLLRRDIKDTLNLPSEASNGIYTARDVSDVAASL
ncbi:retrovirus-related Pol polyprotein from type-1 retrotransposable element R2, partial [Caerostris darwini]